MTPHRYTCQCCGHRTLDEGPGNYSWCPVCHWEDDGWHDNDVEVVKGPNGMTLAEGQRRYRRYGTRSLHLRAKARPPRPDEPLDPDWEPRPGATREEDVAHFLPDYGLLLTAATREARQTARDDNADHSAGRLEGLRDALRLLIEQADNYGLLREEVGDDPQLDLEVDLRTGPTGRYAG